MGEISSAIWTTPELPVSESSQKRALIVPDDLLIALNGAISLMTEESAWQCTDGEEVEDTLQRVMEMWLSMSEHGYAVGTIIPHVLAEIPDWALACDGASHLLADYPDVVDVISSALIDGDEFSTPHLNGRYSQGILFPAAYGGEFGQVSFTLSEAQMPVHNHGYNSRGGFANVITPGPEPFLEMNPIPTPSFTGNAGSGSAVTTLPKSTFIGYMMVVES